MLEKSRMSLILKRLTPLNETTLFGTVNVSASTLFVKTFFQYLRSFFTKKKGPSASVRTGLDRVDLGSRVYGLLAQSE
jgi:hypothetical protein